jgi:hypothetical protein
MLLRVVSTLYQSNLPLQSDHLGRVKAQLLVEWNAFTQEGCDTSTIKLPI